MNPAEEYITKWFIAEITLQIAQKFGVKPLDVIDIILKEVRKDLENERRSD